VIFSEGEKAISKKASLEAKAKQVSRLRFRQIGAKSIAGMWRLDDVGQKSVQFNQC
jgi:hypothetical protein